MVVKTIFDDKQSGFVNPFLQSAEMSKQAKATTQKKAAKATQQFKELGRPNYSWVNDPKLLQIAPNTYNYKNMPYQGTYGLGLANAGINENNISYYLDLMRSKNRANDKSGGWKEIYGHMEKWSDQYNPQLKQYLETGKSTKGVSADTILQATDYGIRAAAQKQQNKQSFLGEFAKSFIGPAVGMAFLGPLGAGLTLPTAGAVGGFAQGGITSGFDPKQTALSTLGGYGAGSGADFIASRVLSPAQYANIMPPVTSMGAITPASSALIRALPTAALPAAGAIARAGDLLSKGAGLAATGLGASALTKQAEDAKLASIPQSILEAGAIKPQFTQDSPIAAPIDIGNIFASQPTVASGNLGLPANPLSGEGYYNQLANALALNTPLPSLNVSPEVLSAANQRFSPFRTPVTLQDSYRRLNPLAVV
tara:strand:+ start:11042 stop:12310 length:1269 start_codon:yes stop_codon:yes gene_type:complete